MRDNWDKDIPPEGVKAKINSECHVSVSRLDAGDSLDYCVIYCTFRIGPGVGVGAGVGVGVDQEPGVGAGFGVRTAPPRLRTPGPDDILFHGNPTRLAPSLSSINRCQYSSILLNCFIKHPVRNHDTFRQDFARAGLEDWDKNWPTC